MDLTQKENYSGESIKRLFHSKADKTLSHSDNLFDNLWDLQNNLKSQRTHLSIQISYLSENIWLRKRGAFDSTNNHKRQSRKR